MWTAPLVVLVICFGSILVFMTIIFLFVYIETRRATGQVRNPSSLIMRPSSGTPHPAYKPGTGEVPLHGIMRATRVTMPQRSSSPNVRSVHSASRLP